MERNHDQSQQQRVRESTRKKRSGGRNFLKFMKSGQSSVESDQSVMGGSTSTPSLSVTNGQDADGLSAGRYQSKGQVPTTIRTEWKDPNAADEEHPPKIDEEYNHEGESFLYRGDDLDWNTRDCLTEVTCFPSVIEIPDSAFYRCRSLISITLPPSLVKIGVNAFWGCSSLTSIILPNGTKTICESAFNRCASLTSITFPEGLKKIESYAFEGCSSLKSIVFPKKLRSIENCTLSGCTSLESVILPDEVKRIGEGAFYGCKSLKSIKIPNSVKEIEPGAFSWCTSLTTVNIPSEMKVIRSSVFYKCKSIGTFAIPSSIQTIDEEAFADCTSLFALIFPSSVMKVNQNAFKNCRSLEVIFVPPLLLGKMTNEHFKGCKILKEMSKKEGLDVLDYVENRSKDIQKSLLHLTCINTDVTDRQLSDELQAWHNPSLNTDYNMSLLHCISINPFASLQMIRLLLRQDNDAPKMKDSSGRLPIHFALRNPYLSTNIIWEVFSANKDSTSEKHVERGDYPLHTVVSHPNATVDLIMEMIELSPQILNYADANNEIPLSVAMKRNVDFEIQFLLYECQPKSATFLNKTFDANALDAIAREYVKRIRSILPSNTTKFSPVRQHGWVELVSRRDLLTLSDGSSLVEELASFLANCPQDVAEFLAHATDFGYRKAINCAVTEISQVLKKRLLFLGRYDLFKGPPLYQSTTSVIVKASDNDAKHDYAKLFKEYSIPSLGLSKDTFNSVIVKKLGVEINESSYDEFFRKWDSNHDNSLSEHEFLSFCRDALDDGRDREVVLKFMLNADEFKRELKGREKLEPGHVVDVINEYENCDAMDFLCSAISSVKVDDDLNLNSFKNIIVMPFGDRNLEAIYRNERPRMTEIREISMQVGEALNHIHENGIIHGDLKFLNIVRFGGRLCLIDMDAYKTIMPLGVTDAANYYDAKYSSGMLPPEMIECIDSDEVINKFLKYFEGTNAAREVRHEIDSGERKIYVVKKFKIDLQEKTNLLGETYTVEEAITEGLPYDLIPVTCAIDLWSFGVVLYTLCVGAPLFDVNRDDEIENQKVFEELFIWNDGIKARKLSRVKNLLARNLLNKLFQKDPRKRYSNMNEVLQDPFFHPDQQVKSITMASERIDTKTHWAFDINIATDQYYESCMSVLCSHTFEASQVHTPSCFIILPKKLSTSKMHTFRSSIVDLLIQSRNPVEFTSNFMRRNLKWNEYYLYLIDESTQKPVDIEGDNVYPIKIRKESDIFERILPLFFLSLKFILSLNTGNEFVNKVFSPNDTVNRGLLRKSNKITGSDSKSLKSEVEQYDLDKKTKEALRHFSTFLLKQDPNLTFCRMKRICISSVKSIWVKPENVIKILKSNVSEIEHLTQKNSNLERKIENLKLLVENLETKISDFDNEMENLERGYNRRSSFPFNLFR